MSSAEKLLERALRSKAGWRLDELKRLYRGFGFEVEEGSKHIMFIHPKYPHLVATVTRKRTLAIGYVSRAIQLITELKALQQEKEG